MPLSLDHIVSIDQLDTLQLHAQIIQDRGMAVTMALEQGTVCADELDDIANRSVEIINAAQAIEILCGRLARASRMAESATGT